MCPENTQVYIGENVIQGLGKLIKIYTCHLWKKIDVIVFSIDTDFQANAEWLNFINIDFYMGLIYN